MSKRILIILLISTLMFFTLKLNIYAKSKTQKKPKGSDIVVKINDQKITRKEFGIFLIKAYGDVALDFLIKKRIVQQVADRNNIKVTEEEVNERLKTNADSQIAIMMKKKGLKNKEDLELVLFKQGMTLDKLRKNIMESIKNQAGVELMVEKILLRDITYTEEELLEAYNDMYGEKIIAKQIVLKTRKKAEEILMKLGTGADFSKLAHKESIDRASAAREGEMLPFSVSTTLGRSVKGLKKNQFSDIIQTGYGYHIIKLIERVPGSEKPFEEVQEQLEKIVTQQKLNEKVQPWLRDLFKESEVEILL